ncbi:hypothetical protein GKE82_24650 [Conexibacter sp. W3-3-2]|uniref:uracil-DNA glycosylase family protein n=1 Tax=Conexibacter sp. W3-3-2 TaxID=2675227 RepID=UPI0012BA25F1|nr:uracil-DNA glycosylase family protein [Conexibacter sp. W3-3-2]MTD47398.1 hypothetical protein [Conexibacter sp. W3-3-2]
MRLPERLARSDEQVRLLARVQTFFADQGLLVEEQPLERCCPACELCWRPPRGRQPVPPPDGQQPRLPALGAAYPQTRVALVGMNSRDDGRQDAELRALAHSQHDFRHGHASHNDEKRSYFHYRAASTLAAVLALRDRQPAHERPAPHTLIPVLDRCARLQAVQCSPWDGGRRSPMERMGRNCQPYLAGQLEILRPDALVLLGVPPRRSIERLTQPQWTTVDGLRTASTDRFAWNRSVALYALPHPAAGSWHRAHRALVRLANANANANANASAGARSAQH